MGIKGLVGNLLAEVRADIASGALLSSRKDRQVSSKAMRTVSFLALLAHAKRKKGWLGVWVMWKTDSGRGGGWGEGQLNRSLSNRSLGDLGGYLERIYE